ncbi:hypothetical protein O9992_02395 [Vibrio lentus]|nr:hypothetical protein [Vibrio lentus]
MNHPETLSGFNRRTSCARRVAQLIFCDLAIFRLRRAAVSHHPLGYVTKQHPFDLLVSQSVVGRVIHAGAEVTSLNLMILVLLNTTLLSLLAAQDSSFERARGYPTFPSMA